jgi:hypothetical protein
MPNSAPDSAPASAESAGPLPLVPPARAPALRPGTGRRPLPDAVAMCSVPEVAPPFDDAPARPGTVRPKPVVEPTAKRRRARPPTSGRAGPAAESPQPVTARPAWAPAQAPAHDTWPSQFAQVLAETLAGARPPRQIAPWTTEQTRQRINQLGSLLASAQQPRVRRVIVTCPARDVLEMTVIVGLGPRVRAVAVRLERARSAQAESDRWCCTAVEAA